MGFQTVVIGNALVKFEITKQTGVKLGKIWHPREGKKSVIILRYNHVGRKEHLKMTKIIAFSGAGTLTFDIEKLINSLH